MKRGHTRGDIFVLIIVVLMFISSCAPIGQADNIYHPEGAPEDSIPGEPTSLNEAKYQEWVIENIGKDILDNAGIPFDKDKALTIAYTAYGEEKLREMYKNYRDSLFGNPDNDESDTYHPPEEPDVTDYTEPTGDNPSYPE